MLRKAPSWSSRAAEGVVLLGESWLAFSMSDILKQKMPHGCMQSNKHPSLATGRTQHTLALLSSVKQ